MINYMFSEKVMIIHSINGEKIVGTFYEKELQKTNEKELNIEKVIKKKKMINYMFSEKVMIIHSIAGLIKKTKRTRIK